MTHRILHVNAVENYRPERFRLLPPRWETDFADLESIDAAKLARYDVVYIPSRHDQIRIPHWTDLFIEYLSRGGHMVINGHIVRPWMPFLQRFVAVPPRPYSNLLVHPAEPGGYFGALDFGTFHMHDGVAGQYARGWSPMPDGAQAIAYIGARSDPKPVDWVWRYPGGGKVFMHNGDCLHWFPTKEEEIVPSVLLGVLDALVDPKEPPLPVGAQVVA